MSDYIREVSLLNTTQFVNEENINTPLRELSKNDEYILNLLNGNRLFARSIWGNLIDFSEKGEKILKNGGVFDAYKKCNVWRAIDEYAIVNNDDVTWDSNNNMLVYKGWSSTPASSASYNVNREVWLERNLYIPEELRGESLMFAVKCSGSTESSDWAVSNARFETIALEVVGAKETSETFLSSGPWENYDEYEPDSYGPAMRTNYVVFRTNKDTTNVRIKIFRTVNDGYLHINKMFLGGVTLPVDNDIETFSLNDVDINNFFDFDNDVVKITATTVAGHSVAAFGDELPKANDLLLLSHMNNKLERIFVDSSKLPEQNPGDTPDENPEQGIIICNTSDRTYTVTHQEMKPDTSNPQVTLVLPNENATMYMIAVTEVSTTTFKVVLSDIPEVSGYEINWQIPTLETKDLINEITIDPPPSSVAPEPTEYEFIFGYEDEN